MRYRVFLQTKIPAPSTVLSLRLDYYKKKHIIQVGCRVQDEPQKNPKKVKMTNMAEIVSIL